MFKRLTWLNCMYLLRFCLNYKKSYNKIKKIIAKNLDNRRYIVHINTVINNDVDSSDKKILKKEKKCSTNKYLLMP